jgi:hypothetical protein
MKERRFFTEHYGAIVVASYTLLMAMVIFVLAMPLSLKIALLVISVAVFGVTMRSAKPHEPPMGAAEEVVGVKRPPSGLDSRGRHAA